MLIGIVAAVVFALLAAAGVAWWLLRDQSPLAGRPRVTDKTAGVSYGIPEGWKHQKGDLASPFTSAIVKQPSDGEVEKSTVIAGRGDGVPESELKETTELAARSNAEFFAPNGSSKLKESKSATVDGRAGHSTTVEMADGEGAKLYMRITVVSMGDSRSVFLLGFFPQLGTPEESDVDAVVASASFK
ncbi:hypothetical protein [Streptomyces cavernicola]|uniref:Secreted protein n=1 Tax=Streptomyces cavernicola TaxID=3043613 RepID=A0ABT6S5S9_9ACTN|nr:hypothetical protein [Streptomyces sp. B-S-A6]MDI3403435.1 hypothetical protein [Streptomyces sp. B-S-A6]